jgi:hypothetical protein
MSGYNSEYFRVTAFFKKLFGSQEPDLVLMIMTQQLEKTFDIGEDINLGIVNNVKRIMENMITNLQNKNSQEIKEVKAEIKLVKTEINAKVEEEIKSVKAEIMANMNSMEEKMNRLIAMMSEKQSS